MNGTDRPTRRVLFVTRTAFMNEVSGSGTGVGKVLELLHRQKVEITVLLTSAYSRSPRLFFRHHVPLPEGTELVAPGYMRFGDFSIAPFSVHAWIGMVCRLSRRVGMHTLAFRITQAISGDSLNLDQWDLTPLTDGEMQVTARTVKKIAPSAVIANYAFLGPMLCDPALKQSKGVIMMHDLLSARVAKFIENGTPLDCPAITEAEELGWLQCADFVMAAQRTEAELIAPKVRGQVLLQPILLQVKQGKHPPEPLRCLFVGTRILPNVNGLEWFLKDVWPLVLQQEPRAELHVAGSVCSVVQTDASSVKMLGIVPSLDDETYRSAVCVVPLLVGSGIKLKLLEALSFSKACVSTSIGIQGLEQWAPGAIEVSDDPQGFSGAVVRLMRDPELRHQREQAAGALIREHFSAEGQAAREFVAQVLGEA